MLHGDRAERRERRRLVQHPLGQVGVQADPLPLAGAERPRLVPDRVRDAQPAEAVDEPGAPQRRRRRRRGRPSRCPASAASSATAAAWPSVYGDFRSTKFATAAQRGVELVGRRHDGQRRLGVDHRVPRADRRRAPTRIISPSSQISRAAPGRTACPAAPRASARPRRRRPRGGRPRRTRPAARAARRSARLRRRARRASRGRPTARRRSRPRPAPPSGRPSCSASDAASAAWWSIIPSRSRRPERRTRARRGSDAAAGCPAPTSRSSPRRRPRLRDSWSYLVGLQRDVVAEPLGLLVGVGVAADVDQQRRVVDDRPLLLVEADPLGQPQRDQALAQHVLHRLPEAEVDAERERRDELGQANRLAVCVGRHADPFYGVGGRSLGDLPGWAGQAPSANRPRSPGTLLMWLPSPHSGRSFRARRPTGRASSAARSCSRGAATPGTWLSSRSRSGAGDRRVVRRAGRVRDRLADRGCGRRGRSCGSSPGGRVELRDRGARGHSA